MTGTSAFAFDEVCFPSWEYLGDDRDTDLREVQADLAPFTGEDVVDRFSYDPQVILKAITPATLDEQPDWAIAVRLVLSEVGPDRILDNRWGLLEAVGIIQTVHNRLDPAVWNPIGVRGVVPWPGCGEGGTFASCADPQQYLGLQTPRAMNPKGFMRNQDRLIAAIDLAVTAWWLTDSGVVQDITQGATSFVHRCGGRAYGEPSTRCDGLASPPDIRGAHSSTGPLQMRSPGPFSRSKGRYVLKESRRIDYVFDPGPAEAGAYATYLWGFVPGFETVDGEG